MKNRRVERFQKKNAAVAGSFLTALQDEDCKVALVHHNDTDGLCAAAALARAFEVLGVPYDLLPIEKLHPLILEKIFLRERGTYIVFLDLGGQNPDLIGAYARSKLPVLILDHHPSRERVPKHVLCLNPEIFDISGDTEISGASVAAFFAGQLLRNAGKISPRLNAELAVYGAIGAYGDRQLSGDPVEGLNLVLFTTALRYGLIAREPGTVRFSAFEPAEAEKIVEILDSLGSIGFYSGSASQGVRFLLGRDRRGAVDRASELIAQKNKLFHDKAEQVKNSRMPQSDHFQWLDVGSSFYPFGVKTIGLFMEHLLATGVAARDKYLVGFQHFPDFQPGIGLVDLSCTKVSSRVPDELKRQIQEGLYPDFLSLMPQAVKNVGGIADGCHRFAAAALIDRGKEEQLIEILERLIPAAGRNI